MLALPGQQLKIKSARFWQLRFISTWQLTGLFTVKLRSVRRGLILELLPTAIVLQSACIARQTDRNLSFITIGKKAGFLHRG